MEKPNLIRAAIENTFADIQKNPEKLSVFINNCQPKGYVQSFNHDVVYDLYWVLEDFPANQLVQLNIVLIDFLQKYQRDLLGCRETRAEDFKLDIEYLSKTMVDVAIKLRLSEASSSQKMMRAKSLFNITPHYKVSIYYERIRAIFK